MQFSYNLLIQLALAALFSIGLLMLYAFFQEEGTSRFEKFTDLASKKDKDQKKSIILKIFLPLIIALGSIISTFPLGKSRAQAETTLIRAGRPGGLNADEYFASQIISLIVAVFIGMFFDSELDLSPVLTLAFAALGFIYPQIWLKGLILKRKQRIFRDLPDTLDLLRLATDAGMDLNSAMQVVVERGRAGPLLSELEEVEREISLGKTRRDAFRAFSDRIAMTEINTFVMALIQAEQLGSSIGPVLKAQSEMARTKRWQLAEAVVNKLPMKMLGPLVVFIFPSSFIVLFTPLLIQWFQSK